MPNYCQNEVTFTHPDIEKLNELYFQFERVGENADDEDGQPFQYLYPTHPELLANGGWYEWRIQNWGTKWDVTSARVIEFDPEAKTLTVMFNTAWSPPTALYQYLHEQTDWRVDAVYFEAGMGFYGWFNEDGAEHHRSMPDHLQRIITAGFENAA